MTYRETNFLNEWDWDLFVTLTFRGRHNHKYAENEFVEWVRSIYVEDQIRVAIAGVIYSTKTQTHIHVGMIPVNIDIIDAIAIVDSLGGIWENRWRHGISSVELVMDREKAARYIQSHMSTFSPDAWDFVYYNKRLLWKLRSKAEPKACRGD